MKNANKKNDIEQIRDKIPDEDIAAMQDKNIAAKTAGARIRNENMAQKPGHTKRWNIVTVLAALAMLLILGGITAYIDPVFHYRAPRDGYAYPLDNERYQNDGITTNFDYDTMITGSSMTANFKTSECDALFDCTSVKVPFSGGSYKEVNDNLKRAYSSHDNIMRVIRSLDYSFMVKDKDQVVEGVDYPDYLTNDNPFDDVNYLWNKQVLIGMTKSVFDLTKAGGQTTSLDDYDNWTQGTSYGKGAVLSTYQITERTTEKRTFTEDEKETVRQNIEQNVIAIVREHPETEFDLFITPYSICYWDVLSAGGEIDWQLEVESYVIDLLLPYENIHLYSFSTNEALVTNLDNYKDQAHYGEWVNTLILEWIADGTGRITTENKDAYLKQMGDFYVNFDYDSLHASER